MKKTAAALASIVLMAAAIALLCPAQALGGTTNYVITNNDNPNGNTISIYKAGGTQSAPALAMLNTFATGGTGLPGGNFVARQQVILEQGSQHCLFVADQGSNDIAGFIIESKTVTGNFLGSLNDLGGFMGLGLAANSNGQYIYATFPGSSTIATFSVEQNCTLAFQNDVTAAGLNGNPPMGMATNGSIMVITYGDGSIESFNIANGTPVSNGDEQFSTGYAKHNSGPEGVDISADGHFAVFGDPTVAYPEVEVSNISSGKLARTVDYGGTSPTLGPGEGSFYVWIGPDQNLVYVSNSFSGQVTALRFNKFSGKISYGCISNPLNGFNTNWFYTSGLATAGVQSNGQVSLAVAEYGAPSSVGIISVGEGQTGGCTIVESPNSPALNNNSSNLESLGMWPPRSF